MQAYILIDRENNSERLLLGNYLGDLIRTRNRTHRRYSHPHLIYIWKCYYSHRSASSIGL